MTEKQAELLQQVATDVAVIKVRTEGLAGDVAEIKEWKNSHPRECPLPAHIEQTVDTPKERKVSGTAILFGIIGAIGVIGSLAVAVLK
jgi:vacuolar-type H+-ATPase catalytic subunit A/Vma1